MVSRENTTDTKMKGIKYRSQRKSKSGRIKMEDIEGIIDQHKNN